MKKITKIGWVGKNELCNIAIPGDDPCNQLRLNGIFPRRGKEDEWPKEDWPPIKVRITIEEVK